jgi:hypothetical protein
LNMNVTPFSQNATQSAKTQSFANKNYFRGFELCEKTRRENLGTLGPILLNQKPLHL